VGLGTGVDNEVEVSIKAGSVTVGAVFGSTTTVETGTVKGNMQPPTNTFRIRIQNILVNFRISPLLPKKGYPYYGIVTDKCHATEDYE
jgi:hypothetical protein